MNKQLQRVILMFLLDNPNEYQLHNATTREFNAYIYDDKGEYLIGGLEVADFVSNAIKLLGQ